jgi:hypothetical protein
MDNSYCFSRQGRWGWLFVRVVGLVGVLSFAIGCASVDRSDVFVRRGADYATQIRMVERVGVMVDALVRYDRNGTNDFFVLEDSRLAITNLLEQAQLALSANGYEVAFAEAPVIGGFTSAKTPLNVAARRKDKPGVQAPPFLVDISLRSDTELREALLVISRTAFAAITNRGELPADSLQANDSTRGAAQTIAARKGTRYLFLIQGNGTLISGGKQASEVGADILIGLIAAAVGGTTAAASTHVQYSHPFLDSHMALVDLERAEVIWGNSVRIVMNPSVPEHYKGREIQRASGAREYTPRQSKEVTYYWSRIALRSLPRRGGSDAGTAKH